MSGLGPDMSALNLLSQANLSSILNKIPGKKQLILDPGLMKPLDRIANMSVLTKAGVEKVFKFDRNNSPPPVASHQIRTYMITSNLITCKLVADQISKSLTSDTGVTHIIILPRKLLSIEKLFEEEGLSGYIELHQFSWEFIPLDYDILSLELPFVLRSQYLCGDSSYLPSVARAIWGLKSIFGNIPNVFAIGKNVQRISKLETHFSNHFGQYKQKSGDIGSLFIFERDVDWASCFLSPLTYEGLLDETFGISCGTVEFGPEVTKSKTGSTKLQLSSRDKMFDKLRNKHFASIFSVLGVTAKQLSAAKAATSNMSITQMKQFVANDLRVMEAQTKAVSLHISASEVIQREKGSQLETQLEIEHALISGFNYKENVAYIEDCMAMLKPMTIPLRLICLLSHCNDGLSFSDFQKLKTQFVQAYGFHHLVTWSNLLKSGIIRVKGGINQSSSFNNLKADAAANKIGLGIQHVAGLVGSTKAGNFQQIIKKLNCVPPDINLTEPNHAGYVFNGSYTPLACKIVEEVLKTGAETNNTFLGEVLKMLPGDSLIQWNSEPSNKVALVLFVGGYTMAEVAAFRWLQTLTGHQFVIAGTGQCSGNKIISDMEKL